MRPINKSKRIAGSLLILGALAIPAHAASLVIGTEIGVDFGPTAPTNDFNEATGNVGSISSGSLIDTSNVVLSGVGFSWSSGGNSNDANSPSGEPAVFNDSNTTDWLITVNNTNNGLITLTFDGLFNGAATYDLLIGAGHSNTNPDTTWTADGKSATTVSTSGATAYVTLTGLTTDGSGNLVITAAGAGGRADISVVSALTLTVTAVPEPSSTALLGLGGLALILRRRR